MLINPKCALEKQVANNLGYTMPATDSDMNQVEKMFAVNVFGPMRMVKHFHQMTVAAKGTIVNIGSVGGIVPYVYGGEKTTGDSSYRSTSLINIESTI